LFCLDNLFVPYYAKPANTLKEPLIIGCPQVVKSPILATGLPLNSTAIGGENAPVAILLTAQVGTSGAGG
jgi:hypothetical protein